LLWIYITLGIVGALVGFVLIVCIIAALMPADFRVSRSANIAAPPAEVFPHVNDLRKWEAWSPWEKIDPALKRSYEGAHEGTGAIYAWDCNKQVGAGRMTITDSKPAEAIHIQIEFLRPFAATNQVEFTFVPQGNQTVVTWTMLGKKVFMMKLFGLVMSMDKFLGGQFEQGLVQLKGVVEGTAKA